MAIDRERDVPGRVGNWGYLFMFVCIYLWEGEYLIESIEDFD